MPLTERVKAILKAQPTDERRQTTRPEFVFVGRGTSLRDRAKKAPAAIAKALGVDFRGHDLRRTAATRMAAAGIPRDHIAKVLNHVEGGARATRVYDRHTYDAEKRMALDSVGAGVYRHSRAARTPARCCPSPERRSRRR